MTKSLVCFICSVGVLSCTALLGAPRAAKMTHLEVTTRHSGATTRFVPTKRSGATTRSATTMRFGATTQPSALPEPTRVTLKLDHVPVLDALRQLFKQADLPAPDLDDPYLVENSAGVKVTTNFHNQVFDLAMLEICRQGWLEPRQDQVSDGSMRFYSRRPSQAQIASTQVSSRPRTGATGPTTAPLIHRSPLRFLFHGRPIVWTTTRPSWVDVPPIASGPFVFVPQRAQRNSQIDLDFGNLVPSRTMQIEMVLLCDPKVRLFAVASALDLQDATDQDGHSLLEKRPRAPEKPRPVGSNAITYRQVMARLAWPDPTSRKIAVLRGTLAVTIVTRSHPVELVRDSVPIEGERQAGGVRFSVGKLEESVQGSTLQFSIYRAEDAGSTFDQWEEARSIAHPDGIVATDADGHRYDVSVQLYQIINNEKAQGTITFRLGPNSSTGPHPQKKPSKVVWQVPEEVQDFAIPVEIHDLPLP